MKDSKIRKNYEKIKKWLLLFSVAGSIVLLIFFVLKGLTIKQITIIGNKHLSNENIKAIMQINEGKSIIYPSSRTLSERLMKTPWVKDAVIRKDLSGTLTVFIKESFPVAISFFNEKAYLIDYDGVVLEDFTDKIKNAEIFLPVIKNIDPFTNKDTIVSALKILDFFKQKGVITKSDSVSIHGNNAEDLTVQINDLSFIIGKGDLEKKFAMLRIVRGEVERRNLKVQYYDLRFPDKVIVKPLEGGSETFQ